MTTQELNQNTVAEFGERTVGVLNSAAIALMVSIGHQTGLFDTMASLSSATSDEIAAAGRLSERYVREWLGAMVTGRIVEYDPIGQRYNLPPERAAWLTVPLAQTTWPDKCRESRCWEMLNKAS